MRVGFRDVRDRFSHIDATFVSSEARFGPGPEARYTVSFYPWWEHPLYIEAIRRGAPWGFRPEPSSKRDVTVVASNPLKVGLGPREDVIDWAFHESHPWLWPYEDSATIFCNSHVDRQSLVEAVVARGDPNFTPDVLWKALAGSARYTAPYCLGSFPMTLFNALRRELIGLGASLYIPREPETRRMPVLFLVDEADYIIAEDFDLELPDFEHRPEWFSPA